MSSNYDYASSASPSSACSTPKALYNARRRSVAVLRNCTKSVVTPFSDNGNVYKNFYIWSDVAPALRTNPELGFCLCLVLPGSTATMLQCKQIDPPDPNEQVFPVSINSAYSVNNGIDPLNFPDIGMIPHTNPAATLDFIRKRYLKEQIYTEAHPLLVAMNPFKDLKNATEEVILKYRDASELDRLPPHVFAVARTALENLYAVGKAQTVIVSGESGAGKTEATKQIMRYLAAAKSGTIDTTVQKTVLAANPVLEAFGNAKTVKNNNSSRFGRFMQLQVAAGGGIESGCVKNFLLEKSRIVLQHREERNYHIFYQLIRGASPSLRKRLRLRNLEHYKYINPDCLDVPGINDSEDWEVVSRALDTMGISAEEKESLLSMVSGILLLGNVEISSAEKSGLPDAAHLDSTNRALLHEACSLLFLDPTLTESGIIRRISKAGSDHIHSHWRQQDAHMLKDSLAKGIYEKLFDWIVQKLNDAIRPARRSSLFMALLDIFGFEVFEHNSLEQLFINITNEMLQKNFIETIFDRETRLYRQEGIAFEAITWCSNDALIDTLIGKRCSLMSCLEDQCLAPGGTDAKFLSSAHAALKGSQRLLPGKIAPHENFCIIHTIGEIQYNVTDFLFKNKDVLRPELISILKTSQNPVTASAFVDVTAVSGKLAKGQLIGSQFLGQLTDLMALINETEPHFIRCVKPNEEKAPLTFNSLRVLEQLYSLSVLEALELRKLGFAYRRPFEEFLLQYRLLGSTVENDEDLSPQEAARRLLKATQMDEHGWRIGHTMVFLQPNVIKELARLQKERLARWTPIVEVLEALAIKRQKRIILRQRLHHLSRVQAWCRQKAELHLLDPLLTRPTVGK